MNLQNFKSTHRHSTIPPPTYLCIYTSGELLWSGNYSHFGNNSKWVRKLLLSYGEGITFLDLVTCPEDLICTLHSPPKRKTLKKVSTQQSSGRKRGSSPVRQDNQSACVNDGKASLGGSHQMTGGMASGNIWKASADLDEKVGARFTLPER